MAGTIPLCVLHPRYRTRRRLQRAGDKLFDQLIAEREHLGLGAGFGVGCQERPYRLELDVSAEAEVDRFPNEVDGFPVVVSLSWRAGQS